MNLLLARKVCLTRRSGLCYCMYAMQAHSGAVIAPITHASSPLAGDDGIVAATAKLGRARRCYSENVQRIKCIARL